MAFWNKKKTEIPAAPPSTKCNHSWKDFPWYFKSHFYENTFEPNVFEWSITEPYLCIYCGKRKDVVLEQGRIEGVTVAQAEKRIETVCSGYQQYLKPRAVVEDMINDFQLVDPQTLYYYEMLHKQAPKTSFSTPSSLRTSTPANHKKDELK